MSRMLLLAFTAVTVTLTAAPLALWRPDTPPPGPAAEDRAYVTGMARPVLERLESYRTIHDSYPRCLEDLPGALPAGATIIEYCRTPSGQDFVLTLGDNLATYRWSAGGREGMRYEPLMFQDVVPIDWLRGPASE